MNVNVPPEVDEQYEGQWIAWDTVDAKVVAHHADLGKVVEVAKPHYDRTGHVIYYRHILPPDRVLLGGWSRCGSRFPGPRQAPAGRPRLTQLELP